MFTAGALGSWLAIFQPVLQAFFNAFGRTVNDWLSARQADQNAKDVGAAQAQVGQANATIAAQQAELQAQENAPASVDDAVKRLEEGSA